MVEKQHNVLPLMVANQHNVLPLMAASSWIRRSRAGRRWRLLAAGFPATSQTRDRFRNNASRRPSRSSRTTPSERRKWTRQRGGRRRCSRTRRGCSCDCRSLPLFRCWRSRCCCRQAATPSCSTCLQRCEAGLWRPQLEGRDYRGLRSGKGCTTTQSRGTRGPCPTWTRRWAGSSPRGWWWTLERGGSRRRSASCGSRWRKTSSECWQGSTWSSRCQRELSIPSLRGQLCPQLRDGRGLPLDRLGPAVCLFLVRCPSCCRDDGSPWRATRCSGWAECWRNGSALKI